MKITKQMQKTAIDILMEFRLTNSMEEVVAAYERVIEQYGLYKDPFTGLPCTSDEWYKSSLEYDRQAMMELYGHCDGLE